MKTESKLVFPHAPSPMMTSFLQGEQLAASVWLRSLAVATFLSPNCRSVPSCENHDLVSCTLDILQPSMAVRINGMAPMLRRCHYAASSAGGRCPAAILGYPLSSLSDGCHTERNGTAEGANVPVVSVARKRVEDGRPWSTGSMPRSCSPTRRGRAMRSASVARAISSGTGIHRLVPLPKSSKKGSCGRHGLPIAVRWQRTSDVRWD